MEQHKMTMEERKRELEECEYTVWDFKETFLSNDNKCSECKMIIDICHVCYESYDYNKKIGCMVDGRIHICHKCNDLLDITQMVY